MLFVRFLLTLDLSFFFGSGLYFTGFAATELFSHLPEDQAGRAVNILFPPFFTGHVAASLIGWVLYALFTALRRINSGRKVIHVVFGLTSFATIVNRFLLLPRIQHVETAMKNHPSNTLTTQFGALHGTSMGIEALVLVLVLVLLWLITRVDFQLVKSRV